MKKLETAIFANGCFWCTEAIFQKLNGVESVMPGYIGGNVVNPSYNEVCSGATNHAEAVKISYDSDKISYNELLHVFFATHDPTTLNRQGNDTGTQYRSEIFYVNDKQKIIAENLIQYINEENIFEKEIATKTSLATTFYPAEAYHLNYFMKNGDNAYCSNVIAPKILKFMKDFNM